MASGAASSGASGGSGNRARFEFDVDLQGVTGTLVMEVEAVNSAGVVFGSGPNPAITGVIGTGATLFLTAGELISPVARYAFTGENNFADFTDLVTLDRFRVQWIETAQGMTMRVNPFGPGPTSHDCVLTSAELI